MDTKALRQKILDLAIRGKLVPQDPNDEPASVLLERIRVQKQQMVKEGKLKAKDIKNDTVIFVGEDNLHYEKFQDGSVKCIEDEIPFEIPQGWEWTRLKNICSMVAGKSKSSSDIRSTPFDNCYPCFGGNGIRGFVDEYNYNGTYNIIGRQGALCGNINIASGKFYATEHAVVVTLFSGIDFRWSNFFLEGLNLNKYSTAVAQPGLSVANILKVFIPIPPQNEQARIGTIIHQSLMIIDYIASEQTNLFNRISMLKSRILDLAIRGKLIPQDPNDEPASVLLERIRQEKEELIKQGKIKRDKKESVIFKGEDNSYYEKIGEEVTCIDDEIPFEIPENWCWCRIDNIVNILDNQRIPISFAEREKRIIGKAEDQLFPYYGATGVTGYIDDFLFDGRYILLGEDGAPFLDSYASKAYAVSGKFWVNNHAHILQSLISENYLLFCLNSINYTNYVHGTTRLKLTQEDMRNILIPIPPENEQNLIDKNIFSIIKYLNGIEASLN